jgi:hypothetical protein
METIEKKEFVKKCISTGGCIGNNFNLSKKEILEIEDILSRYNDGTAKTKINKILKNK